MMLTDLETMVMLRAFREELTTLETGFVIQYYGVGEAVQHTVDEIAVMFHSDPLRVSNIICHARAKLEAVIVDRLDKVREAPSKVLYMTNRNDDGEDEGGAEHAEG